MIGAVTIRETTMKHIIQVSMIVICIVALVGCKGKTETPENLQTAETNVSEANALLSSESTSAHPADVFEIVGKVTYMNLEGGFYAIEGDDGKKYDPINLPESFKKDGLKVTVTARLKKGAMSFHMYGAIIDIVSIAAR
jgi:hypothetical protein